MDTAITSADTFETVNAVAELFAVLDAPADIVITPFRTARSARIAFGKVERAWEAARDARINVEHAQSDPETKIQPTDDERASLDALRAQHDGLSGDILSASPAFNAYCDLWSAINNRPQKDALAVERAAWDKMVAVYNQAEKQGFWIRSYHLNYNPTRDLIANNCD